jgi:hypothetical protein
VPFVEDKKTRYSVPLEEICIHPHACLTSVCGATICESCECNMVKPSQLMLSRSRIPRGIPLFRVHEWTNLIIASNDFVEAAKILGLGGIQFEEVQVADE